MKHVRGSLRLLLASLVTLVMWLAWLVGRRPAVRRLWARSVARILGVSIAVRGRPPAKPSFFVCNHLSYLDIIVLWTVIDGDFLAKSDVARWPIIGALAASADTLFVDRARRGDLPRVLAGLEQRLARGRSVLVFPEGTSSSGEQILPFKPGTFEVAVRTGCPVACVRLAYATPAGSPPARTAVCWWGDMTFFDHFYALLCLPSVQATVEFAARPPPPADRKTLAAESRRILQELHEHTG